jgi:hypothetical protein
LALYPLHVMTKLLFIHDSLVIPYLGSMVQILTGYWVGLTHRRHAQLPINLFWQCENHV